MALGLLPDTADVLSKLTEYEEAPDDGADRKTHIVNPPKNIHIWQIGMTAQEVVDIARATGQEVVALCDYRWIPKLNPEKFDICQSCLDLAGELMRGMGE